MRHLQKLIFLLIVSISLIGCQDNLDRDPDITGYVVEQTENNILVASESAIDLSSNGGVRNFYQMVWFSNPPNELSYGDKVEVWFDEIEESYPNRSTIVDYNILEVDSPEGATLNETEVLNQVLSQHKTRPNELFAVHKTHYNNWNNTWMITLIEIWTQEKVTIEHPEADQI
ncbi:MAG TPA: DUF3221 domain-containing protein [Bacilli bacterium]|nr:DUF3221 domain-containing protein [Bacilli bacterium]